SGGTDKTIRVWDLRTREVVHLIKGHDDAVRAVAFSPDSKLLASGGEDNLVRLWAVDSGKEAGKSGPFNEAVRDLAFSPRGASLALLSPAGRCLVSAGADRTVQVRPARLAHASFQSPTGLVTCAVFSPDGKELAMACADQTVKLWDRQTGQLRRILRGHNQAV